MNFHDAKLSSFVLISSVVSPAWAWLGVIGGEEGGAQGCKERLVQGLWRFVPWPIGFFGFQNPELKSLWQWKIHQEWRWRNLRNYTGDTRWCPFTRHHRLVAQQPQLIPIWYHSSSSNLITFWRYSLFVLGVFAFYSIHLKETNHSLGCAKEETLRDLRCEDQRVGR